MTTLCPQCGADLNGTSSSCPACGATVEALAVEAVPARKGRKLWRRLLLVLLALLVFVGVVVGAAYAGIYYGERDRELRRETVIRSHYSEGIRALNEGRYERAVSEFSYILQLQPDHALAAQGLAEARIRLEVIPTPTLEAAVSLAEQLLTEAEASYRDEDWVATARTLTQLRALDAAFEQQHVEDMLFISLRNAGTAFLEDDVLEVGISYLDQAIALRPLDAETVNQRNLAARYLDALSYWGVDWQVAIDRFTALYNMAPGYKDVARRLYMAYVAYGDYFVREGELCPAEMQYTLALRMFAEGAVEEKRAAAAQTCLIATPVPLSGTEPMLTPQPIPGFSLGRLAYPVYSAAGVYDLYALYADGRIIRAASNADQAWWEWGTGRLAYRSRGMGGIYMVLPEEGVPLQLLAPAGQAWPALSPDGRQLAYAARDAAGEWNIYIAYTDGTGEPRLLGPGRAPAWGRGGLLAYTGCMPDGGCGIIVVNPNGDQPGTRLTGSANDVAVSWSPDGGMMAYMSNFTGSWNLYLLNPQGGVQLLTSDDADEGLPVWSPDGSRIAFISNRGGTWALYVMTLDGSDVQRILDLGPNLPGWENQRLSWAP